MDTIRICQQCQKPLPPNAPEGLCPECLARMALGSEPVAPGNRTPPAPGELAAQFPQLEIVELLGMGGMGMVYKARQRRLDRLVALKILPLAEHRDAAFTERFEREARALARLNHPGIVMIHDFGQTQDYYYFVMEYVDGLNLRQLIQTKTLEPRQALELITQICTALQFAHDEKIVHRDIKPENILITKKGQVKIADFGLAKLLGGQADTGLTASQMVMGTMNYMAPEQRENTKDVDHRADIYSLGVVFYEMLTGEVPMGRFEPPSKKVEVDVRLDEVVLHALEREPARRYQQVSEVKSSVQTIITSPAQGGARGEASAAPDASAGDKGSMRNEPRIQTPGSRSARGIEWSLVAEEIGKILVLTILVGLVMRVMESAWPLALLLFESAVGPQCARQVGYSLPESWRAWTANIDISEVEKRWIRIFWFFCVAGLVGYGVWMTKSMWPLAALYFLYEPDEEELETKAEPGIGPFPASAVNALPFKINRGVSGPFGRVNGMMRLEIDALVMEYEIKSIWQSVRRKSEVIRLPYSEIALADLDSIDRLVLRTTQPRRLESLPNSGWGQVTLTLSGAWDDMELRAAKQFITALNQRMGR